MLKQRYLFLTGIIICFFVSSALAQDSDPNMGLIPAPVSVKKGAGEFVLSQETALLADSLNNRSVLFLGDYLKNKMMFRSDFKAGATTGSNQLILTSAGADALPDGGYHLVITSQQVTVTGKGAGLFYGVQTLIQLIQQNKAATAKLPAVDITDYPRFGYRGFMLDVCRHFYSVDFVKKVIDEMAFYKLNNFHWHLTDDQGWRVEIKKYPRLTQISSQRAQTVIGNYHDRTPQQFDGVPHGGYYTQDQIREVIKYAADRYINIVPEIEMPGHAMAALAAYPELSCDPKMTYKVAETWGVFHDVYCPSEKTFAFLEDVLTEVIDLFPSKYIHVGGDEVPKDAWKKSDFCQKLIKKLHLKNEEGLQSYFVQRIEKFVNSKGRSIIGWDEILEGGLSPNATVMSWRGEEGGIAAAKQSHNVIMTPSSGGLYLDHAQGKIGNEPLGIGGNAPLAKTYSYNPTPAALTPDQQKFIMGVQANLWTEYIATEPKVQYMLFPRLLALSEVAWTPLANKNFKDFSETRLPTHLGWLDAAGIDYRVPEVIGVKDTIIFGSQMAVNLKAPVKGARIYYTIDGYKPDETALPYEYAMNYNVPADQYRDVEAIAITPAGHRSNVLHTVVWNKTILPALSFNGVSPTGLKYQLYSGSFANTAQLKTATVVDSGTARNYDITSFKKSNAQGFAVIYSGYFKVDEDGVYGFSTRSDDGSVLLVDDVPVVDNDGKHALMEQGGSVPLQKGFHKVTIKYFDAGSVSKLGVYITLPGKPKGELSPDAIYN